jgi:hypothetical protein
VLARVGRPEPAAILVGALTGPLGILSTVPAHEAGDRQAAMDELRSRLGAEEYEAAMARGASMSYEDLVVFALAELDHALALSRTERD